MDSLRSLPPCDPEGAAALLAEVVRLQERVARLSGDYERDVADSERRCQEKLSAQSDEIAALSAALKQQIEVSASERKCREGLVAQMSLEASAVVAALSILQQLLQDLSEARRRAEEAEAWLRAYRESASWRLTGPLRQCVQLLRRWTGRRVG